LRTTEPPASQSATHRLRVRLPRRQVVKEAEHILEHERERLVPPKQAPFRSLYAEAEVQSHDTRASAVGTYWPSFLPISRAK
jgi:hypothetical protein